MKHNNLYSGLVLPSGGWQSLIGFGLALPSNSKTWLERISKGKPSSLLGLMVSDEGKKFYNTAAWGQANSTGMPPGQKSKQSNSFMQLAAKHSKL